MSHRWGRSRVSAIVALAVLALATTSCSSSSGSSTPTRTTIPAATAAVGPLTKLSVDHRGATPTIVDGHGRQVILRGANLNAIGDYYQADPTRVPTKPPTAADWAGMAAHGFSVVRLIVSWSKLEPTRGTLSESYLRTISEAVSAAQARGMYTVIDLHQDAWGKYIASPRGTTCPSGQEPAIGWDGAPRWATITDGASTCRPPGSREGAPAVQAAFENFYENRDGIRDAYAKTVGRLAGVFSNTPAVAGYDLMNEPNKVLPDAESTKAFTALTVSLVRSIRAAEGKAHGLHHLIFLEPIVLFPLPGTMSDPGRPEDANIVFAPHNYGGVLNDILDAAQTYAADANTARDRGWPLWTGEYGIFDTKASSVATLASFAEAEDDGRTGSAEWQWRQRCGDPHSVAVVGGHATTAQVQLNTTTCPADTSKPEPAILRIVGRPFARTSPGHLTAMRSDPDAGTLSGRGQGGGHGGGDLVLWLPGDKRPTAHLTGLSAPKIVRVPGGWYLTAHETAVRYSFSIARH